MLHCDSCNAGCHMDDLVDKLLLTYGKELDREFLHASRERVARYLQALAVAGKRDPKQLTIYGRAYLKELQHPDPRYTGC
jgi:GTP cyclohydrolase I